MLIVLLSFMISSQMSEVILNLDLFKSYRRACLRRWLFWRSCYCFGKFVWLIFSFKKFWSPVQWTCFLSPLQVLQVQFSLSLVSFSLCVWVFVSLLLCSFDDLQLNQFDFFGCASSELIITHVCIDLSLVRSFVSLSVTLSVFLFFLSFLTTKQ